MTAYHPRSAWTSTVRPTSKLSTLSAAKVKGVAVHYTGDRKLGQTATVDLSARRLEGERRFHTDQPPAGRGWTDIAYQVAIDVAGNVFDARGIDYRSAANGSRDGNDSYGAVTFLLGVEDVPTPAMIEAFRHWRHTRWLKRWPGAVRVVGHRDLYSTACPGDRAYDLVRDGTLLQAPGASTLGEDDDMPTADEIVAALLNAKPGGRELNVGTLIARGYEQSAYNTTVLHALRDRPGAPGAEAVAEAVVARLGQLGTGSLDLALVKTAVREVLTEGTGGTP